MIGAWRRPRVLDPERIPLPELFGIRSTRALTRDWQELLTDALRGRRFQVGPGSAGLLRPDLSMPAWLGQIRSDGLAPIFNLFDRHGGGHRYSQRVSRRAQQDFRGGRLSYDEHDGVDFVIPPGTPLLAAAPGTCVMVRDRWLRGGLTVALDHGGGIVTHYTHCARPLVTAGQPVRRGEPVAVSGTSGADMTHFFPWVPPHVHWMVWRSGQPIDPFRAPGEPDEPGTWQRRNDPLPSPVTDEPVPPTSPVDAAAMQEALDACQHGGLRAELRSAASLGDAVLGAMVEEMLHHERFAWPASFARYRIRPAGSRMPASDVQMTLPLPAEDYRGTYFADTPATRP
jgi:murein DD-endopeptidase MepM/ murein hydrolase activator NlpD